MGDGWVERVAPIPYSFDRRAPTADDALIKTIADHGSWPRQDQGREARPPQ